MSTFRLAEGGGLEELSDEITIGIDDPNSLLEEVTPSNAGGTEVHEGWRTGGVTLHEIEEPYFVE